MLSRAWPLAGATVASTLALSAPSLLDAMPVRWAILIALFALVGATGRTLWEWSPIFNWPQTAGRLMLSIFVAWLVGLACWDFVGPDHPTRLLAATGAAGFLGTDVVVAVSRWLIWQKQLGRRE